MGSVALFAGSGSVRLCHLHSKEPRHSHWYSRSAAQREFFKNNYDVLSFSSPFRSTLPTRFDGVVCSAGLPPVRYLGFLSPLRREAVATRGKEVTGSQRSSTPDETSGEEFRLGVNDTKPCVGFTQVGGSLNNQSFCADN